MNTVSGLQPAGRRNGMGMTLAATSFGFVAVQLDVTIVNVAMPSIGASFTTGVCYVPLYLGSSGGVYLGIK
ncbi:hypothetical protein R75461_08413 [Paraburkholderia nemoris]|uniref:hypothetical protein n=1 Tax=Paraburkholderia nemoris TaxID=2793076 RepID=UPI00190CF668|nr:MULTISPECIES: hypothetical protein [Paraburkholderia]MBK3787179.1 hypothetical protein [Paraburkholderia aspalathi]CAE6868164.1 hypothetical protein R75461_08413 [Paraburkholderia nemoris]